eukprot:scaffold167_cov110-Cylindrotheca_fusiformis.AAC.18
MPGPSRNENVTMRAASMEDLRLSEYYVDDGESDCENLDDSGISADPNNPVRTKRRGRRRRTRNDSLLQEEPKILKSPHRIKPRRNSLLARFISATTLSTSKRSAATASCSASADTISNAADPDNASLAPDQLFEGHSSSNSLSASQKLRSLIRRSTIDSTDAQDYQMALSSLQDQANELQAQGKTELAIETLQEALKMAEDQQDTLANKTEMLCKLVQLHLKVAQTQEGDVLSLSDIEDVDDDSSVRERQQQQQQEDQQKRQQVQRLPPTPIQQWMTKRQNQLAHSGLVESFHHQKAKRYLLRIKPDLVQPDWLGKPSSQLVDYLIYAEAWELAIIVADQLYFQNEEARDHEKLATMHYQVASQKLDAQKNVEALQHLQATVTNLQKVPKEQRDMELYVQVLHLLATEYQAQQEYDSAMEVYKEQMKHTPPERRASLYCQVAQNYLARGKLDKALEQIEVAKNKMDADEMKGDIRSQILQIKGDVFFKLGRIEDSLECYQQALHEVESSPADKAKLLYTMGRLCIRLGRVRSAITYFTRELEITKKALGQNHLSVSRVLHQLAKLYDEGLGEHKMALLKYNKALTVELAVLQECHIQVMNCVNCNPVTHRMCPKHGNRKKQISSLIRETKRCQGRVHFKLGDLEKAMQTSFESSPGGPRSRRHSML